jgi:predicted ATPase/serine/threonine protein kinase
MTPERWQRVETLFQAASARDPGERAAFLEAACGGDAEIRREVEELLAAHQNARGILDEGLPLSPSRLVGALEPSAASGERTASALVRRCPVCHAAFDAATRVCPEHGEALVEDPEALIGTTLDGLYRVERLLGTGGMSAVYFARHALLRDAVAVKLLPEAAGADPEWVARFLREGRAARAVRHPNLVTVFELRATSEGRLYMVQEYVEGHTLREELGRRGRLSAVETSEIVDGVAAALDAAHEAGVVHRDVKPENVMLGPADGTRVVKLLDLGVTKFRPPGGETTNPTRPDLWVGTPPYMPPEQWGRSEGGEEIDGRADVYSLGVVAYEMVTGRRPFAGSTTLEVWQAHVASVPRPASEIAPEIPEGFSRAIAGALAKNRADRPPSAGRFAGELRASLDPGYELLTGRARTESAPGAGTDALPSLIGREADADAVLAMLRREGVRLVTLTGPGGIGKTRLATHTASRLSGEYPRVAYVELGPVDDPLLFTSSVAQALGIREAGGTPLGDLLREAVRDCRLLLVLDNFEHLMAAAPDVALLLAASRGLKVLATSRSPLRIRAEHEFPVGPLSVPDPRALPPLADLAACPAVALFVERARSARSSFALSTENAAAIAEICARLEGLPLAIELAAARVRVLPPRALATRLESPLSILVAGPRDLPDRQRTMRGAIAWSYNLLTPPERDLLRRLSVFVGGFTIEAAEAVCGDDEGDGLASLVNESLLQQRELPDGEPRYRMLETVREFGREMLEAAGHAARYRRAHATFFVASSERADAELLGPNDALWLGRLERDHANCRAALAWALAHEPDLALRLAGALGRFWHVRGHYTVGRTWVEEALRRSDGEPTTARARALVALGYIAFTQGDVASTRSAMAEAIRISEKTGDRFYLCRSLLGLGNILESFDADPARAEAHYERALAVAEELGNKRLMGMAFNNLGEAARVRGDHAAARAFYERTIALFRGLGGGIKMAFALANLGAAAYELGDLETSRSSYLECLAIARETGSKQHIAHCLDGCAALALAEGNVRRAARLCGAAQALREQIGQQLEASDRGFRDRFLARIRDALGDSELAVATEDGRSAPLDAAIALAVGE